MKHHYHLKKLFRNKLNLEDTSDKDYSHAQKVFEGFSTGISDYHDLYVQCDTLLLTDIFEKFRDTCIEIYGLDPSHFLTVPGLAWQLRLKKKHANLELLTDHMLLMIEEGIRGGMCQSIHRYAKASNKYMNNYDKSIELSYLMQAIYMDGQCLKNHL